MHLIAVSMIEYTVDAWNGMGASLLTPTTRSQTQPIHHYNHLIKAVEIIYRLDSLRAIKHFEKTISLNFWKVCAFSQCNLQNRLVFASRIEEK
jgi:hypothetical protein